MIFVVYMAALSMVDSNIHPFWHTQIALLKAEEVTIPSKYADYTNIFSSNFATKLPKYTRINDHLINLIDDKQLLYYPIYTSLKPVELKTLKTYIETNLANSFIKSFKSPAGASILFIRKKNISLWLYIDYQGFNNLTIRNWYLLFLIS